MTIDGPSAAGGHMGLSGTFIARKRRGIVGSDELQREGPAEGAGCESARALREAGTVVAVVALRSTVVALRL
jgi:hypothetical protein